MVYNLIKTRKNTFKQFGGAFIYKPWTTISNGGRDGSGPILQCMLISILDFLKRTNPPTNGISAETTIAQFREMHNITASEWPEDEDYNRDGVYSVGQAAVLDRIAQHYNLNLRLRIKIKTSEGVVCLGEMQAIPGVTDLVNGTLVVIVQTPGHFELLHDLTPKGIEEAQLADIEVRAELRDLPQRRIAIAEVTQELADLEANLAAERQERLQQIALEKQIETALEQLSELKLLDGMVSKYKELNKKKNTIGLTTDEQLELNNVWTHIEPEYNKNISSGITLSKYILNKIEETERTIKQLTENEKDVEATNISIGGSMYKKKYLKYKAKYLALRKSLNI